MFCYARKLFNKVFLPVLLVVPTLPDASLANTDAAVSAQGIDQISVCMNFNCKTRQQISISREDWESVANWLQPAAKSPEQERENIKKAIGWMEVIVGRYTPTYRDVGGDLGNSKAKFPGQLDCIDESINTTNYLKLFEENNLLKYHRVVERAYRRSLFDQHWAGQIEQIDNGARWVVDSWFQNNGYLPYLQQAEAWNDIPVFTANLDSSQKKKKDSGSFFGKLFD